MENLYFFLLKTHLVLSYIVLLLLLVVIARAFYGRVSKARFSELDQRLGIYLTIAAHLQLLIGIAFFFVSPNVQAALADMGAAMKDETLRRLAIEHPVTMLLAVTFITIGRVLSKKAKDDAIKFRRVIAYNAIGLIFLVAGMPWEKWLSW